MTEQVSQSGGWDVGVNGRDLTAEERRAIKSLKALGRRWPRSLTLFSWSGSLNVFKTDEWADRDCYGMPDDANEYVVDGIEGIPNDGGDP